VRNNGHVESVATLIKEAQVAVASWIDEDSPYADDHGKCLLIVKGEKLLKRIVQTGRADEVRTAFINCSNLEQAQKMRDAYGDGAGRLH